MFWKDDIQNRRLTNHLASSNIASYLINEDYSDEDYSTGEGTDQFKLEVLNEELWKKYYEAQFLTEIKGREAQYAKLLWELYLKND